MVSRRTAPRVDPGVWEHPKTRMVAEQCRMQTERVVFHLTQMWGAVLAGNRDGLLFRGSANPDEQRRIQQAFGAEVKHDRPDRFLKALLDARFVEQHGAEFVVHDWAEWQGSSRARTHAGSNYHLSDSYSGSTGTTGSGTGSTGTPGTQESGSYMQGNRQTGGRIGGAGGKDYERKTTGEGPTSSAPFTRFMWWVTRGFGATYAQDAYDPAQVTKLGKDMNMALVAECYIAIHRGLFGDDFDQRNLSARHAMKKSGAFAMFKQRKRINGSIIPLATAGVQHYPSTPRGSAEVAAGDAGAAPERDRAADPFADHDGSWDMDNDSKVRDYRARQAAGQQDIAF